jgi:signal transduction histidine kinase
MATPSPDDLVALNRASTIARLFAGTAHDINNALLVIGATAELLEEQPDKVDAVTRATGRIRSHTAKAAATIGDVLQFARGNVETRERIDLRDIVSAAVSLRAYAVNRAGLEVAVSAPDARVLVQGNRVLLLQATLNLIDNAERALAGMKGSVIQIDVAEQASSARLRVTDSGAGVAPGDRERIFEPFVTAGPRQDGAGLGLPAARRIAESHGGGLRLEPSESGASFVLELPVMEAAG